MNMPMFCSQCGRALSPEAPSCPHCGTARYSYDSDGALRQSAEPESPFYQGFGPLIETVSLPQHPYAYHTSQTPQTPQFDLYSPPQLPLFQPQSPQPRRRRAITIALLVLLILCLIAGGSLFYYAYTDVAFSNVKVWNL